MKRMRSIPLLVLAGLLAGCVTPQYGVEQPITIPIKPRPIWAVAPAINLSGETDVDPLLQADLLYAQLQAANNVTVIPVNRVADVYASLRISKVESEDQAAVVCQQLGCDALIVPTITLYDPYNPPKVGASLQLLSAPGHDHQPKVDARELARRATPGDDESLPPRPNFLQAVGMYDAQNGSVRAAVFTYAKGRNDPYGPLGIKEYFVSMDRYSGFVYHALIEDLIRQQNEQQEADDARVAARRAEQTRQSAQLNNAEQIHSAELTASRN